MENEQFSDEHLMAQMAAGSTEALGRLAERYQDMILSLTYRYTQNWPDAEDIAQEALIRTYKSAGRYQGQSKFKTWLYRIVVNLCMDHHRKKRSNISLDNINTEMATETAPDPLEVDEIALRVKKAVQELPKRQRITLILHRYENLSHADISQATGWTQSAVESLLVRAYENLREKLSKFSEKSD